ncbi:MAG: hypothetical protein GY811_17170 [Myxococcales bacterium]|nr:hypothetical protein [Myxococcales bacterium]
MSDEGQIAIERLQEIMTALMEQLLFESLQSVDGALTDWKAGDAGVFETHAELLRHAAKAERLAERMARIGLDNAGALLRDAYDAGLVEHDEFIGFVGKEPSDVPPSPPLAEEQVVGGLPDKKGLIEELLGQGAVLLHIDARHTLAQVPDQFRQDPKLVLRFGYDLTPAIIDLAIDMDGMYGTLTFGGIPTRCVLPWGCIYSVVREADQRGMVWPEDVPECVVDALQEQSTSEPMPKPGPEVGTVRTPAPQTSASQGEGRRPPTSPPPGAPSPSSPPPESPAPGGRGGHLKLVK